LRRPLKRLFYWLNSKILFALLFISLCLLKQTREFGFFKLLILSASVGITHSITKKSLSNRLRCPKCKHINYVWKRKPIRVEELGRSETYLKQVTEQVGYTETESDGDIWGYDQDGHQSNSTYTGSSVSRHYAFRNRPHQVIELRQVFICKGCSIKIGRRYRQEFQIK